MNEKQISNEMADKLLFVIYGDKVPIQCKKIKCEWREAELIEESALEKLVKEIKIVKNDIERHQGKWAPTWYEEKIALLINLSEQTIAELEARIKELEEGKR